MQNEALEAGRVAGRNYCCCTPPDCNCDERSDATITAYQSHWLEKQGEVVERLQDQIPHVVLGISAKANVTEAAGILADYATDALALIASLAAENAAKDARIAELEAFQAAFNKKGEFSLDEEELSTIETCIRNDQHQRIMALELYELVRVYRRARSLTKKGRDNG